MSRRWIGVIAGGEPPDPRAPAVAIVGVGPRGLYCLERLVAECSARPLPGGVRIYVFNRSPTFGASPVYDPDQPDFIPVNNSVGEIDLWGADDPAVVAGRGPNFTSWYQEELRPETPLTGGEYLSRAVVGRYLHEGFLRIAAHLPRGVALSCLVGEVTDIRPVGPGYEVTSVDPAGARHRLTVDKILLATGHSQVLPTAEEQAWHDFAARHPRASFVPFVYPVSVMDQVPPGVRVAMRGTGLTFVDAVLALTEGRGGSFERSAGGDLGYRPGGREPHSILPFSRSGLPMAPKPVDLPLTLRPLTFVTPAALAGLRQRSPGGQIDLERDLWPLVELEMELQYYRVAMGDDPRREDLDACGADARRLRQVIDGFRRSRPDEEGFDWPPVLDPVAGRSITTGAEFHAFVGAYLEQEIARARLGLAGSGVKAAIAIWNEVRAALIPFMAFGGLTPDSHRRLMEHYHPRLKRVVFGPPVLSMEKILALVRAGLVDFSMARNPKVTTDERTGCFVLRCPSSPDVVAPDVDAPAEVLVDARYPPVDVDRDATPLYRNLQRRGLVRAFENRAAAGLQPGYRPGAIDMTPGSQFVVDARGRPNEDIAVVGIPTEGNLLGNLSVTRDEWAGAWAAEVVRQLHAER